MWTISLKAPSTTGLERFPEASLSCPPDSSLVYANPGASTDNSTIAASDNFYSCIHWVTVNTLCDISLLECEPVSSECCDIPFYSLFTERKIETCPALGATPSKGIPSHTALCAGIARTDRRTSPPGAWTRTASAAVNEAEYETFAQLIWFVEARASAPERLTKLALSPGRGLRYN